RSSGYNGHPVVGGGSRRGAVRAVRVASRLVRPPARVRHPKRAMTTGAVLLDLDDTLVDTPTAMRASVVAALEGLVGDLPEPVRRAVADQWLADPARHFLRYELGEISFVEQRRARFAEIAEIAGADADPAAYATWEE